MANRSFWVPERRDFPHIRRRRNSGSEFSPFYDPFHIPFPAFVGEVLSRHTYERKDVTYWSTAFSRLPAEILHMVFSILSPPALDAARFTCRSWWLTIMSNSSILSTVLDEDNKSDHRTLAKRLECTASLVRAQQHPDAWRTRFRSQQIDLVLSKLLQSEFCAAMKIATEGFVILQLRSSLVRDKYRDMTFNTTRNTLAFYRFESTNFPVFVGHVEYVGPAGTVRIRRISQTDPPRTWIITLGVGALDDHNQYIIRTRDAWGRFESPYILEPLRGYDDSESTFARPGAVWASGQIPEHISPAIDSWTLLDRLPLRHNHACSVLNMRPHTAPLFLAEWSETGDLYLVHEDENDSRSSCKGLSVIPGENPAQSKNNCVLARLSQPQSYSCYQNITVVPLAANDGTRDLTIPIAVIWQDGVGGLDNPRELCIYEVPESLHYPYCTAYKDDLGAPSTPSLPNAKSYKISGRNQLPCTTIQGKRVSSLNQGMGGLHPQSPIRSNLEADSKEDYVEKLAGLGGLELYIPPDFRGYSFDGYRLRCYVWGPSHHNTQITFRVFDFSYADPNSLLCKGIPPPILSGVHLSSPTNPEYLKKFLGRNDCCCSLHDEHLVATLPATIYLSDADAAPVPESKNWFWSANNTPLPLDGQGVVEVWNSMQRQQALAGKEEWLKDRIRGMKRLGLSDWDIAETWFNARWTDWGAIAKPEGWKDLKP